MSDETLREAAQEAAKLLHWYAGLHAKKGTREGDEKAVRNAKMATRLDAALTAPTPDYTAGFRAGIEAAAEVLDKAAEIYAQSARRERSQTIRLIAEAQRLRAVDVRNLKPGPGRPDEVRDPDRATHWTCGCGVVALSEADGHAICPGLGECELQPPEVSDD